MPPRIPVARKELARVLGRRVSEYRADAELTQAALSSRTGLHTTEISLIERGGREPRLATILKLALGLEVMPGDLVNDLDLDGTDLRL